MLIVKHTRHWFRAILLISMDCLAFRFVRLRFVKAAYVQYTQYQYLFYRYDDDRTKIWNQIISPLPLSLSHTWFNMPQDYFGDVLGKWQPTKRNRLNCCKVLKSITFQSFEDTKHIRHEYSKAILHVRRRREEKKRRAMQNKLTFSRESQKFKGLTKNWKYVLLSNYFFRSWNFLFTNQQNIIISINKNHKHRHHYFYFLVLIVLIVPPFMFVMYTCFLQSSFFFFFNSEKKLNIKSTTKYTFINEILPKNKSGLLHAASNISWTNLNIFLNFSSDIILVLSPFSAVTLAFAWSSASLGIIVVIGFCISKMYNKKKRHIYRKLNELWSFEKYINYLCLISRWKLKWAICRNYLVCTVDRQNILSQM